ncbi:MAG: T9SS type A sorting domain-containing protein [Dysgonamonadaceae bacterium]|nr:T9SS type A sorting domain-containing protein [Dysgonamonadaceae bacterium]
MKTNLLLILFCCQMSVFAQQTLAPERNLPRPDDEIIKQQVEYKEPGRTGENVVWDFSRLNAVNDSYSLFYYSPQATNGVYVLGLDTVAAGDDVLFVGEEHNTMYYYRFDGNRLWTLGHENPTTLLRYSEPLLTAVFPIAFGEKYSEKYSGSGLYSATDEFSVSGQVDISADATGIMVLPSKDTLRNVIRVKSVRSAVEKDGVSSLENVYWYARGYRYPVFETVRLTKSDRETFASAFYFPPDQHYYLDDDAENFALHEENPDTDSNPWAGLAYNLFPNPVTSFLNIELYLPKAATVRIQVHSQAGSLVLSSSKGRLSAGLQAFRQDVSALPVGNYVITVLLDEYPVNEILMKR